MKKNCLIKLLLISFTLFYSCKENKIQQTEKQKVLKVKVEEVEEYKYFKIINCSGRITSEEELKLSFKTGGIISENNVTEGQQVNRGQILAKLNLSSGITVRQAPMILVNTRTLSHRSRASTG